MQPFLVIPSYDSVMAVTGNGAYQAGVIANAMQVLPEVEVISIAYLNDASHVWVKFNSNTISELAIREKVEQRIRETS